MLLRLRGPDGMVRITVDKNDSVADLGRQVSDPRAAQPRARRLFCAVHLDTNNGTI